jgi:hypothetical protein
VSAPYLRMPNEAGRMLTWKQTVPFLRDLWDELELVQDHQSDNSLPDAAARFDQSEEEAERVTLRPRQSGVSALVVTISQSRSQCV